MPPMSVVIVDPGLEVVRARLADEDGNLSDECGKAIARVVRVRRSFEVELRESGEHLHAVMLQEGRPRGGGAA